MKTLHLQSFPHSRPNLGSARISQAVKAHPIWVRAEPGTDLLGHDPPLSLFALHMFRDFISFNKSWQSENLLSTRNVRVDDGVGDLVLPSKERPLHL